MATGRDDSDADLPASGADADAPSKIVDGEPTVPVRSSLDAMLLQEVLREQSSQSLDEEPTDPDHEPLHVPEPEPAEKP